jgi:hypothetical protein
MMTTIQNKKANMNGKLHKLKYEEKYTSNDESWILTDEIQEMLDEIIKDPKFDLRHPTRLSLIGLKKDNLRQEIKKLQKNNPNNDIKLFKIFNKDNCQRFIIKGVGGHMTVNIKESVYAGEREEHTYINEISEDSIAPNIDEIAERLKTIDKLLLSKIGFEFPVLSSYAKKKYKKNGLQIIFENDKKKRFVMDYGNSPGEKGVRLIKITEQSLSHYDENLQNVTKNNIVDEEYKLVRSYNDLIVKNMQTLIGMIEFEEQLVLCIKERILEIDFKIRELSKLNGTDLINNFIKEFKCKIDEDKKDIEIREELINKHKIEVERIHSLIQNISVMDN